MQVACTVRNGGICMLCVRTEYVCMLHGWNHHHRTYRLPGSRKLGNATVDPVYASAFFLPAVLSCCPCGWPTS